jgi:hypothetical protein
MCELWVNHPTDEGLSRLADKAQIEAKYHKLADDDKVDKAAGLELLLKNVDDWSKISDLKGIRKRDCGRHRLYFEGRHSDCKYTIIFVLCFKKTSEDKPDSKKFQNMIRKALDDTESPRQITLPTRGPMTE